VAACKGWLLDTLGASEGMGNTRGMEGDKGSKTYGLCPHVAERVVKQGGGNPTKQAIAQLFEKTDAHTFGHGSFLGRGVVVCI